MAPGGLAKVDVPKSDGFPSGPGIVVWAEGVAGSGSSATTHSGGAPTALAAGAPRVREIAG